MLFGIVAYAFMLFSWTTFVETAVYDLCNVSKVLELILFADDTNIFYSHTDASYLMEVVNLELKKITCWFYTNKLSINVKKSNFHIQTETK